MKTKIIYISGNEVFDMNDIRAAFEEVRNALNLDNDTVLFGVPVDADDAGLVNATQPVAESEIADAPEIESVVPDEVATEIIPEPIVDEIENEITEPVVAEQPKRRGRPRKETPVVEEFVAPKENEISETESVDDDDTDVDEKIVPILSVLSQQDDTADESSDEESEPIPEIIEETVEENIIDEIPDVTESETEIISDEIDVDDDDTADLEKLLSAMTPLAEDVNEKTIEPDEPEYEPDDAHDEDVAVDATLEQLATEFAESQDKIATENKSARGKIGKLRNILPFKQSKHKDQGLGDLFGWAGVAANDEDFSVPGFFTNAASKK